MLGHASAALTLDRYGHLFPGRAQSVAEKLDEMARQAIPSEAPNVTALAASAGSAVRPLLSPNPTPADKPFPVVGVGIDPTTSRFSGARSTD